MWLNEIINHYFSMGQSIAEAATDAPQTSETLRTTIVVVSGGVISSALAAFAIIYPKRRENAAPPLPVVEPVPDPLIAELRRQIRTLERNAQAHREIERHAAIDLDSAEAERDFYKTYLWNNGTNPMTLPGNPAGENNDRA